jgi:transcription elongation GreA/GreB family factor
MSDLSLAPATPEPPVMALAAVTSPDPAALAPAPTRAAVVASPAAPLPIASLPVGYGSTVEIEDLGSGHQTRYKLVHSHEANPRVGLLSEASPVGKALLGRCAGEHTRVHTPRGLRELLILAVA